MLRTTQEKASAKPQPAALILALTGIALLFAGVVQANHAAPRAMLYVALGVALGITLLAADFGFAGGFKRALARDFTGLRAHLFTFAIAMVLIVPMVAAGSLFGIRIEGFARHVGIAFLLGGALFGIGMQLAGGCASGTLYQLGGGGSKYLGTLAGFIAGSVFAASHIEIWWALPSLPSVTLFTLGSWPLTLAIELALMALLFRLVGGAMPSRKVLAGGAMLALLNAATVLVAGSPWSETWAFTLWGTRIAAALGAHPETWRFFRDVPFDVSALVDRTSIMDLAIPLGAMLAAALLGRFRIERAAPRVWLAATLGGLLMGYGARLSGGCNIGSYFSTIASGDLSGWAWAIAALGGSYLGLRLRPRIEATAPSGEMRSLR
jgi:uncharacterized membrane protein YedE/YeeE